jgi:hypothetical protein
MAPDLSAINFRFSLNFNESPKLFVQDLKIRQSKYKARINRIKYEAKIKNSNS